MFHCHPLTALSNEAGKAFCAARSALPPSRRSFGRSSGRSMNRSAVVWCRQGNADAIIQISSPQAVMNCVENDCQSHDALIPPPPQHWDCIAAHLHHFLPPHSKLEVVRPISWRLWRSASHNFFFFFFSRWCLKCCQMGSFLGGWGLGVGVGWGAVSELKEHV